MRDGMGVAKMRYATADLSHEKRDSDRFEREGVGSASRDS